MFNTPLSFEAVILILIAYALFSSWITWIIVRHLIRQHNEFWQRMFNDRAEQRNKERVYNAAAAERRRKESRGWSNLFNSKN